MLIGVNSLSPVWTLRSAVFKGVSQLPVRSTETVVCARCRIPRHTADYPRRPTGRWRRGQERRGAVRKPLLWVRGLEGQSFRDLGFISSSCSGSKFSTKRTWATGSSSPPPSTAVSRFTPPPPQNPIALKGATSCSIEIDSFYSCAPSGGFSFRLSTRMHGCGSSRDRTSPRSIRILAYATHRHGSRTAGSGTMASASILRWLSSRARRLGSRRSRSLPGHCVHPHPSCRLSRQLLGNVSKLLLGERPHRGGPGITA